MVETRYKSMTHSRVERLPTAARLGSLVGGGCG